MKRMLLPPLFLLCACAPPYGTGTGNPFSDTVASPAQGTVSAKIFYTACQILKECHSGLNDQVCGNGLFNLVGFSSKLGVDDLSLTAGQIVTQEAETKLTADANQGDKCIAQMLKLDCGESKVRDAYDPASPQPFAKTPEILDPVCKSVFSP